MLIESFGGQYFEHIEAIFQMTSLFQSLYLILYMHRPDRILNQERWKRALIYQILQFHKKNMFNQIEQI